MLVLNIKYAGIRQWLKLIFNHFMLVSYFQEHPLYKNQAAKFPAILDSFFYLVLTVSGVFQYRWVPGVGGML